jgi:hypothetical protein
LWQIEHQPPLRQFDLDERKGVSEQCPRNLPSRLSSAGCAAEAATDLEPISIVSKVTSANARWQAKPSDNSDKASGDPEA